jgi:two-component system chemotaxis sensor kinase CheA
MPPDPYRYFRIEARDLTDQLGQGVLDLEKGAADPDAVARMLRLAHTLKGAARVVKQNDIADHIHAVEDVLAQYRRADAVPPPDRVADLLSLVDRVDALVAALPPPPGEPAPAAVAASAGTPAPASDGEPPAVPVAVPVAAAVAVAAIADVSMPTRVDYGEVDNMIDAIGEAQAQAGPLRQAIGDLERVRRGVDLLTAQLAAPAGRGSIVTRGTAPDLVRSITAELGTDLAAFGRHLTRSVERMEREIQQVRANAEQLRLVPAGTIFPGLQRCARDAAAIAGRNVTFDGVGGDVRLDPQVLSAAYGALLHMVRNAVAHGVEPEVDRRAAGKPAGGRVTVAVQRHGTRVVFACRDDGRGFHHETIRKAAVRAGLPPEEVAAMPGRDLIALVLKGGISTSDSVTELAGRGVGLDAARDVAERLGGTLRVDSEPGLGTTVELAVPLSLLSANCIVVEVAAAVAAIPLDAVRYCLRLQPADLAQSTSGRTLRYDDQAIPFVALAPAFAARESPSSSGSSSTGGPGVAVVLTSAAGTVAVGVDRILGTAPVIVRALPPFAPAGAMVGGVSLDGDGNPRVVLDPDGLVQHALSGSADDAGAGPPVDGGTPRPPVLVIDDSLTTRMLERSILESAGYDVEVAASGEEGLEKARTTRYGLFLVDIEMPGMDGFTFVEQTRSDPALRGIPSILVSSRASAQDRERGVAAGAVLHVAKTAFNQNELLEHIGKLVG